MITTNTSPNTKPFKAKASKAITSLRLPSVWERVQKKWEEGSGWTIEEIKSKNPDKCIEWKGRVQNEGYGLITGYLLKNEAEELGIGQRITPKGRVAAQTFSVTAHRMGVYLMCETPIPGGSTSHCCGNPLCVNPLHVALGTHSDNVRDGIQMGRKNRQGRGHKRLDEHILFAALSEVVLGKNSQRGVERKYGIKQKYITTILGRKAVNKKMQEMLKKMYPAEFQAYKSAQYKKLNP